MSLPLMLETARLANHLLDPDLLLVDVSSSQSYAAHHITGAVHIAPASLQCGIKPATGKIPDNAALSRLFSGIGLSPDKHVVCYDDEGGGWAGRLIWTLDAIGHSNYSWLNGGITAWLAEGRPVASEVTVPTPSNYQVTELHSAVIAEIADILPHLGKPDFAIWDARSREEYEGSKVLAARGGHIPGAAHLDWLDLMDRNNHLRLLPLTTIQQLLNERGLSPDKTIVTHCQSHHRSGLTYLVAKILGYPTIKGYHGSWSEWGNRVDTPVVTGNR